MESARKQKALGLALIVVSIGLFVASVVLKQVALIAVGGGCLAIGAASLEKSKSSSWAAAPSSGKTETKMLQSVRDTIEAYVTSHKAEARLLCFMLALAVVVSSASSIEDFINGFLAAAPR